MRTVDFQWPGGAHIAVVFNMSWESWPKTIGTSESNQRATERAPRDARFTRGMRWIYEHAYGECGGMQRLLDLWSRHGIRASCYADGLTVSLFPELAREVRDRGHEYLVQGWDHNYMWDMTAEEQEVSTDHTIEAFRDVLGIRADGYSSSGGHLTHESFDFAFDRGFKYICGMRNCDVPFIIRRGDQRLVGMNSYALTDYITYYGHSELTPRDLVVMWRDFFDTLYDEGQRGFPKMLAYGTHPFVSHAFRTRPLEDLIAYVKSKPRVWIATRGEIADWVLENYPDMDLGRFYPEAAASDRYFGLCIGLGGDEALAEARRYRKQ